MKLNITDRKVWRTNMIEVFDKTVEPGYVAIQMRVCARFVHAFAFTHQRTQPDTVVVSIYDFDNNGNECEFRYWIASTVKAVRGLKIIALATLRHHDQAKAEVGG